MQEEKSSLPITALEVFLRDLPHLGSKHAQSMAADLKEIRESAELPENPWRNY